MLSSAALVRKDETLTSSRGNERMSPTEMLEKASFRPPVRRPYFCLFFTGSIFYRSLKAAPALTGGHGHVTHI